MADLEQLAESLINGDRDGVAEATQAAIDEGLPAKTVLEDGLIVGMTTVGQRFRDNEIYVPEVLLAARAMHAGMEILKPELASAGIKSAGTVLIGTVKGDMHDIGKNLVAMMLAGGGLEVVDVGIDVSTEQFVERARQSNAQVVAMSALLTTTMPKMAEVIAALREAGIEARTMIGGAPVTQSFADEIGADGYAADAATAVDVAKALIEQAA
jgi:5-methyltetrahydrofolate--homocysteine methyltransferase